MEPTVSRLLNAAQRPVGGSVRPCFQPAASFPSSGNDRRTIAPDAASRQAIDYYPQMSLIFADSSRRNMNLRPSA